MNPSLRQDEDVAIQREFPSMRIVMVLIVVCMIAGVLSTIVVPGSDEQIPAGSPLEEPFNSPNNLF